MKPQLNEAEAREIRGQMAAAEIAGDPKLYDLCRRALSGLDPRASIKARLLCRYIWCHSG